MASEEYKPRPNRSVEMGTSLPSGSARETLERTEEETIADLAIEYYIGSYFDAIARQVEYRLNPAAIQSSFLSENEKARVDRHIRFPHRMFFYRLREKNEFTKQKLTAHLRNYLLARVSEEVKKASEAEYSSPFKYLPPVPSSISEENTSSVETYLASAKEAFLEFTREVGESSYAGPAWAKIADAASDFWKCGPVAPDELFVKVFHLEHNTGEVFGGGVKPFFDLRKQSLSLRELIDGARPHAHDKNILERWNKTFVELQRIVNAMPESWHAVLKPLLEGGMSDAPESL